MADFGKQGGSTAGQNNEGRKTGWAKPTSTPNKGGPAAKSDVRNATQPGAVGANSRKPR